LKHIPRHKALAFGLTFPKASLSATSAANRQDFHNGKITKRLTRKILPVLGLITVLGSGVAQAVTITNTNVSRDGYYSRIQNIPNSFTATNLYTMNSADYEATASLIQFDLAGLDYAPADVNSVKLRLNVLAPLDNTNNVSLGVYKVAVPWTTDNNTLSGWFGTQWPADGNGFRNIVFAGGVGAAPGDSQVITNAGVVEFDVTEMAKQWLADPGANHGIMLSDGVAVWGWPQGPNFGISFSSSRAASGQPALVFDVNDRVMTNGNTITTTYVSSDGYVTLLGESVTGVKDVNFTAPTLANFGSSYYNWSRSLIRFNLAGVNALPAQVSSVKLRLTATTVTNTAASPLEIYKVAVPWDADAVSSEIGFYGSFWPLNEGGNRNIDYAGGVGVAPADAKVITEAGEVEFDVTEMAKEWLANPAANHGILLRVPPTIWGQPGTQDWIIDINSSRAEFDRPTLVFELGAPPAPTIAIARNGSNLEVTWTGGTLQSTTDLANGPWTAVEGATSPLIFPPFVPKQFYRAVQP